MKVDNNVIIHEAEEYINNNLTVKETAAVLGVSKRTLQIHFKRLELIDKNLYDKVRTKQEQNQQAGRIKGGQTGKATSSFDPKLPEIIAKHMIKYELTYESASEKFEIPKSTLYEMTHNPKYVNPDLIRRLDLLAIANQHNMTVESYEEKNRKK